MKRYTDLLVRELSETPQPVARQLLILCRVKTVREAGSLESGNHTLKPSATSDTRSTSQVSQGSHLCVSILRQAVGEVGTECAFPNAAFPRQHQDPVSHRLHLLSDFLHGCKGVEEVSPTCPSSKVLEVLHT